MLSLETMSTHTTTLYREDADGNEIEIEVTGDYTPGSPDVYYTSNGDPGYPGDPEEVEITEAVDPDGNDVELTELEEEKARLAIIEMACD